jgi:hypothetical protein
VNTSTDRAVVYLTTEEAAERLRFTVTAPKHPTCAFLNWAKRDGLRPLKRGRVLLWDATYLDAFIARRSR